MSKWQPQSLFTAKKYKKVNIVQQFKLKFININKLAKPKHYNNIVQDLLTDENFLLETTAIVKTQEYPGTEYSPGGKPGLPFCLIYPLNQRSFEMPL